MPKARIETEFTGNDASFMAAAQRVERRGQTLSSRLTGLFRRTPERRTEVALSGFVADLSSGNVSGAISGLTGRMSGFGLVAGVAIGAAVELFMKAKQQVDALDKSVGVLNQSLARPLSQQSALSAEGIGKEIEMTQKNLDDVIKKRQGFFIKVLEKIATPQAGSAFKRSNDNPDIKALGLPDDPMRSAHVQEQAFKRVHDLRLSQVKAEEEIVDIQRIGLQQGEREAALAKIRHDADQKVAGLRLQFGSDPREASNLSREVQNVRAAQRLSIGDAERKFDLKEKELTLEENILRIGMDNSTSDEKRLATIKERVAFLQKELSTETDPAKRHATSNKLLAATDEQTREEYNQRNKPGNAQWTPERAENANYQFWLKEKARKEEEAKGPMDWFIKHTRNFGMRGGTLLKSNEDTFYGGPGAQGPRFGPLGAQIVPPGAIAGFGAGSFMDVAGVKSVPGKPPDESGKDFTALSNAIKAAFDSVMKTYWGGN